MALRKLLTNLEQGLNAYPNHNTPSDVGGFNYGQSTSIFDHKQFDQKSLRFGQGTAFDRPGGGFSNQPFQTNNITRELGFLLDNYGLLQKIPQGVDTVTDGFIRGGVITHAKRLIQDTERIGRFLLTPKGLSFITKQVGLQKSNPKIDEPGAGFLNTSNANQRTYNLGINTLASVASAGTGIRIKREGLLPTANKGYADSDSLFEDNDKNRLWNLFEQHIEGGIDTSKLYDYSGGPDSLYGIGKTTISKAKINRRPGAHTGGLKGVLKRLFNSNKNTLAWSELDWDVPQKGYLDGTIVRPGDYDKNQGNHPITIPSNHIYDDTDTGEGGDINFPVTSHLKLQDLSSIKPQGYIPKVGGRSIWSTDNFKNRLTTPQNLGNTSQFYPLGSGTLPNSFFNTFYSLTKTYQYVGDKILNLFGVPPVEITNGIPPNKRFQPPNSHLKDRRPHTLFEPVNTSTTKAINFLVTTKGYGTNYQLEAYKALGKQTYHREERVNIGNPGAKSSRDGTRDPYLIQTRGKGKNKTHNYNLYKSSKIDKLNAMDVFESEGDFDVHAVRDLIRFRFEMINNDTGKSDTILFRALLDNIDDNFSATHNTFKYNGRGEEFYTYNSFKRNINFNFKIAATSRHEMMPLYRKLNFLVSNTAPDYGATGRMRTPFTRLTIGAWCDRIPGVINSVNIKWQKDYPWEISISSPEKVTGDLDNNMNVLPHVMDVSVQFTPVHNFLPEKSIHSPFILPHTINRHVRRGQRWTVPEIPTSIPKAGIDNFKDGTNHALGIELEEFADIPPTSNNEQGTTTATTEEPNDFTPGLDEDFFEDSIFESPDATTGETPFVGPELDIEEIDLEEEEIIDDVVETTASPTSSPTPPPTSNRNITAFSQVVRGVYPVDGKLYNTQNANGDYRFVATYVDPYGNTFEAEGIGAAGNSNQARDEAGHNAMMQFATYYELNPNYRTDPIKYPEVLRKKAPIPQYPS